MNERSTAAGTIEAQLQQDILRLYGAVAENPAGDYHFFHGAGAVARFGYRRGELRRSWQPSRAGQPEGRDAVLDLGSGAGLDSILAARQVGRGGNVYGVDFNTTMPQKARQHARESHVAVEFLDGRIEDIPLGDESVDVVISNGVINLALRKRRVFEEMWRVLRPGGRVSICDIVSARAMPSSILPPGDHQSRRAPRRSAEDGLLRAEPRVTWVRPWVVCTARAS